VGQKNKEQCTNITSAVVRPYEIDYSASGNKWTAPSKDDYVHNPCIPLDSLCTDIGGVTHAGNLGTAGTVFLSLGLAMMVVYTFLNESKNVSKVLLMGATSLVLSWVMLLASWATFASMMGQSTTCYIESDHAEGIVAAKGKFGDIINGSGSYTYYYVIGAWVVLTLVLGVVIHRIFQERRLPPAGKEDEATNV